MATDSETRLKSTHREQHDEFLAQYLATREKKIIGIGREVVGRRKGRGHQHLDVFADDLFGCRRVESVDEDGSTFPIHLSVGEMLLVETVVEGIITIDARGIGDQRFFTGVLHDISDRKQAEERALQAERLAVIGQMISVVTHESRNAFQRMQANLEMLAMNVEDQPQVTEYITRIHGAEDSLHYLHEELRTYAAPIVLDYELCRVDHLMGKVLNEVSAIDEKRQIRLHPHTNGCDSRCEVDPFRMSQLFRNMVNNSLAACPDPLEIDLLLSDAELDGRAAVNLLYRDNGPGLNDEQRERIFEPFFTTKSKGTGLGMAIARRIVEAHGGQITVNISRNATPGAEFAITLPRQTV